MSTYHRAYMNCGFCEAATAVIKNHYRKDNLGSWIRSDIATLRRDAARDRAMGALEDIAERGATGAVIAADCIKACAECDYSKPEIRLILDEKVFNRKKK